MKRKTSEKFFVRCAAMLLAVASAISAAGCSAGSEDSQTAALQSADFILSLQEKNGAICESRDNRTVNQDSDMEYALMGLGAAYQTSGREKYLTGLERGIKWLAERQEMEDSCWKGSWWYLYDTEGKHVPAPQGAEIADVRGVDTTCALFVYLLDLDRRCAGKAGVWSQYEPNGRAALNFLLRRSRDGDGLTWSSFQKSETGEWKIYRYKYSADQGDVWLGYRGGAELYGERYRRLADQLAEKIPQAFFARQHGRYCLGMEADGSRDWTIEDFSPIQAQGYIPWLLGDDRQNREAVNWLKSKTAADGSLHCFAGDPAYSLSGALLCMGAEGLGKQAPKQTVRWLRDHARDKKTGGIYDSLKERTETCNVAGFYVMALLEWSPFKK
jgi:hypothetical protein